jgi:von Willebrand factor A domain-containing protein 5
VEQVSKFDADLGGTEILKPMDDVLKALPDPDLPRHVYLLTDGAVSNT